MKYEILKIKEETEKVEIRREDLVKVSISKNGIVVVNGEACFSTRIYGEFKGNAVYLNPHYDYSLGKDKSGAKILVPSVKER